MMMEESCFRCLEQGEVFSEGLSALHRGGVDLDPPMNINLLPRDIGLVFLNKRVIVFAKSMERELVQQEGR